MNHKQFILLMRMLTVIAQCCVHRAGGSQIYIRQITDALTEAEALNTPEQPSGDAESTEGA